MKSDKIDKQRASEFFKSSGLKAEHFGKHEIGKHETPDFRVFNKTKELAFFCEVKSIARDEWVDKNLPPAPPGGISTAIRVEDDSTYNTLTFKINKAVKQFEAVNPNRDYPNVLVFVNHDHKRNFDDLKNVLDVDNPIFKPFSRGRIKDKKFQIHLYIWLDDFEKVQMLFTKSSYLEKLRAYFPGSINYTIYG